jgi:hypothetical protein
MTPQLNERLTDRQQDKLVTLLERVEAATNAQQAVWFGEDDREDIREIREAIED